MADTRFKAIKVYDGLFIYKDTMNSPFYQLRLRIPHLKKYKVLSTGTANLIDAKEFAKDFYLKFNKNDQFSKTPYEVTFKYWAKKYLKSQEEIKGLKKTTVQVDANRLLTPDVGMCAYFGHVEISKLTNSHLTDFFTKRKAVAETDGKSLIENNTKNKYISLFRSVLKLAVMENALARLPDLITYKVSNKDNPRPSFSFDENNNEYQKLLDSIRLSIKAGDIVRYNNITIELYNLVVFLVHGFMRPTVSEVFSIRYKDIKVINTENAKTLQIQINKGKTGFRILNTTPHLIGILKDIKKNNPDYKPDDYIFMKDNLNRQTVIKNFQRQFSFVLKKYDLEFDEFGQKRSLYSCRHLAIQMRFVKSGGKINILWFAKNCGTSVEMLERFYAKYLPNSFEVIKNLQSFAD